MVVHGAQQLFTVGGRLHDALPQYQLPKYAMTDLQGSVAFERFDLSLGTGLGKLKGRMFRIGHLGDSNDLTLLATLAGVEMGLKLAGVALAGSGVQAAMDHFSRHPAPAALKNAS